MDNKNLRDLQKLQRKISENNEKRALLRNPVFWMRLLAAGIAVGLLGSM
jgi:hypothetical protein